MKRTVTKCAPDGSIISTYEEDVSWVQVRTKRDQALVNSDWRAMSDREIEDDWRLFRQFLRDLPQNHFDESDEPTQGANAAADAWEDYDKPEGAE